MIILFIQKKYGSLFFLPPWLRSKRYENMKRDLRMIEQEHIDKLWHLCLNPLWQNELYYLNSYNKVTEASDSKVYYETKWGFPYHPKWFYLYINSFQNCSHWEWKIPKDGWDD